MNKQLSDEQLDKLMQRLLRDAAPDESLVDEIADSPTLWWSVQRNISGRGVAPAWSPRNAFRRWLMIGVPAAAALLMAFGIFTFRPADKATTDLAGLQQNGVRQTAEAPVDIIPEPAVPVNGIQKPAGAMVKPGRRLERPTISSTRIGEKKLSNINGKAVLEKTEIKSEFISLSYAGNPESGQIVRVKVPSSMMVTLGLVQSVEKPSSLIDAEVVVGDDGTNHAIRFIR